MTIAWVIVAVLLVGGLAMLAYGQSGISVSKVDYNAALAKVDQKQRQRKASFVDQLVPLLKAEFPESDAEITPVTVDPFVEFTKDWQCAHHPEDYADNSRAKSIDSDQFREELKSRSANLLPIGVAPSEHDDFDGWFARMDSIIRIATERSWG